MTLTLNVTQCHVCFDMLDLRCLKRGPGSEALAMVEGHPDLVILDVNLPDISGFSVCKQIKGNESTSRIPVLHLSATMVSTDARVAGLEGGADGYLVQPVEPTELMATIRALLRVRRAEEALWKSEQQYRLFFETNPLACWVFSASDLRILAVNEAAVSNTDIRGKNSWISRSATLSPESGPPDFSSAKSFGPATV